MTTDDVRFELSENENIRSNLNCNLFVLSNAFYEVFLFLAVSELVGVS